MSPKANPVQKPLSANEYLFHFHTPGSSAFYKGLKPSSFLALFTHNIAMDFAALNTTMPTTEHASNHY